MTRPGLLGFRVAPSATQGIDWAALDSIWAAAGALDVFSAGWLSDHLSDASMERGGTAFESLTTAAALAHRVPGKWIGIAVLANTFRHPALVAKAATAIDNATGGRFVLGLGAGWHAGEHASFGIPLPAMQERFARYESAVATLHALFSDAARQPPGVTREDPLLPAPGCNVGAGPDPARWSRPLARRAAGPRDRSRGALCRWLDHAWHGGGQRRLLRRAPRRDPSSPRGRASRSRIRSPSPARSRWASTRPGCGPPATLRSGSCAPAPTT